jgi:hypothetical protein
MGISRILLFSTICSIPLHGLTDAVDNYAPGLKDSALKTMLHTHYQPAKYCSTDVMSTIDCISSSDSLINHLNQKSMPSSVATLSRIVQSNWMLLPQEYIANSSADLHNLFYTQSVTASDRGDIPFGNVTKQTLSSFGISIGYSPYYSDIIQCIEPADNVKGDIARAIFYIATIYPCSLWSGWGNVIMANGDYPTLSEYAKSIYLSWHRQDPVDDCEQYRDKAIASHQGNNNPFVTHPQLVEYIWGDNVGKSYGGVTDEVPKQILRSTYKLTDTAISLSSPYIPGDAEWTYNGSNIGNTILPQTLGVGKHELRYTTPTHKGKIIVTITQ